MRRCRARWTRCSWPELCSSPSPNPRLCPAACAHWIRDRLCEAGLVNAPLPSALDVLFVAARGPDAFAAPPMTGAGLW